MGTCFCRIEGRCLNKREFVFHTLNNNYQQWKEDNIPQSSKSPLEWRFSGLFGWRHTDGFASARLKGWKDTIADIKGIGGFWDLTLCPNTDTLLYPLFDIAFSMTKDIRNPPSLHAMPHRRTPLRNEARGKTLCSAIPYFCYRDGATLILATVWLTRNYKIACGLVAKKSTEIHA